MQPKVKRAPVEKALLKMNKSLGWLADQIGTDPSSLSKFLKGERSPSPTIRAKLMETLKISNWDILFKIEGK